MKAGAHPAVANLESSAQANGDALSDEGISSKLHEMGASHFSRVWCFKRAKRASLQWELPS